MSRGTWIDTRPFTLHDLGYRFKKGEQYKIYHPFNEVNTVIGTVVKQESKYVIMLIDGKERKFRHNYKKYWHSNTRFPKDHQFAGCGTFLQILKKM